MGLQELSKNLTRNLLGGADSFENKETKTVGKHVLQVVVELLVAGLIILLSGFLVKILWNNSMPYMFTTARPVSSLLTVYAFMLMVYFVL
jgi:hypothetical protein